MSTLDDDLDRERKKIEKAKERIKQLNAQKAKQLARQREAERKLRDHIMLQEMGVALRYTEKEYNDINPELWDAFWRENAKAIMSQVCLEPMNAQETRKAWDGLRVKHREEKAEKRELARAAAVAASEEATAARETMPIVAEPERKRTLEEEYPAPVKQWECPHCGQSGFVPSHYYYKNCECGARIDLR